MRIFLAFLASPIFLADNYNPYVYLSLPSSQVMNEYFFKLKPRFDEQSLFTVNHRTGLFLLPTVKL